MITKEQKRAALLAKHQEELQKFDSADNANPAKDEEVDDQEDEAGDDVFDAEAMSNDIADLKEKNKDLVAKHGALSVKCDDMLSKHKDLADKFETYMTAQKKAHEKFEAVEKTVEKLSKMPAAKEIKPVVEREIAKESTVDYSTSQKFSAPGPGIKELMKKNRLIS